MSLEGLLVNTRKFAVLILTISSTLLKENDSVVKMMNEGSGKDGENEWIDKRVNSANYCTCTVVVVFPSRSPVIS